MNPVNKSFSRLLLPIIFIAIVILASWHFYSPQQTETSQDSINTPLPSFSLPSLFKSEETLSDKDFKGHVSILNIWASWCPACQQEHPMLMEIKNKYHIPIYGVIYNDSPDDAKAWLEKAGNPYIIAALDTDKRVSQALDIYGIPETYIVDRNGMIRYHYTGVINKKLWETVMLPLIKTL